MNNIYVVLRYTSNINNLKMSVYALWNECMYGTYKNIFLLFYFGYNLENGQTDK